MKKLDYWKLEAEEPVSTKFESGFKEIANALAIQRAYNKSYENYNPNMVYLCGFDKKNDDIEIPVFIGGENILNDLAYIAQNPMYDVFETLFVHEHSSYEEAFQVALMMKETSNMCYKS